MIIDINHEYFFFIKQLKECIRCIDQFYNHAPFRQSKLTRVLRDCFIGNGKTVLIATVSPTEDCVPCSLNTLQYANRVRQMTLRNRKKPSPFNNFVSASSEGKENNNSSSGVRNVTNMNNRAGNKPTGESNLHAENEQQYDFNSASSAELLSRLISNSKKQQQQSSNPPAGVNNSESIAKQLMNVSNSLKRANFYNGYTRNINSIFL
jgi:hypothetical protein